MKKVPTKYTKEQLDNAKQMYFCYRTYKEISKQTGVSAASINYYVKQSWGFEREERKALLLTELTAGRRIELTSITRDGITAIKVAMKTILQNAENLSLSELSQLTKVLESLDKINRLDAGNPTEITQIQEQSIEVINPFGDDEVHDIKYEDLE